MNMNMKTKKDYELLSIVLGLKISTNIPKSKGKMYSFATFDFFISDII